MLTDPLTHPPVFVGLGETGLGKSTLMDSLFNTNFESTPSTHKLPNVKLKAHTYELQESNVQLKVNPAAGLGCVCVCVTRKAAIGPISNSSVTPVR